MGYVYETNKLTGRMSLCCDDCGKSGKVRKYRCPFGWCQARAYCPECAKGHKPRSQAYKAKHRAKGCETANSDYLSEQERRADILASGAWLRNGAVGENGGVKVWFKNNKGEEITVMMAKETYRALPLTPATLEDFQRIGTVTEI